MSYATKTYPFFSTLEPKGGGWHLSRRLSDRFSLFFFFIRSTSQDMWQTRKKGESVQLHQLINVKCKVEMRFCKNFRHLISLKYCRCLESKWSRRIEFWESAQFKTRQSAESVSLPQLSCPTKKNIVLYDLKSNGVQIIGKKHIHCILPGICFTCCM